MGRTNAARAAAMESGRAADGAATAAGRLPTFFILGAMKCGTTSLFFHLRQHPDVYTPEPALKEARFFDYQYERGIEYYQAKYFGGWSGERARGEATPHYLSLPFVADRIRRDVPDAKLIAILRDPVERAHSHWWWERIAGREDLPFRAAMERGLQDGRTTRAPSDPERWRAYLETYMDENRLRSRFNYIEQGNYAEHLRAYQDRFSPAQMKVILLDDLARDPHGVVRDLWGFLGVDPAAPLRDTRRVNPQKSRLERWSKAVLGPIGIGRLLPAAFKRSARRWLAPFSGKPDLREGDRELLAEYYRPRNRALESLLQRDLPGWDR